MAGEATNGEDAIREAAKLQSDVILTSPKASTDSKSNWVITTPLPPERITDLVVRAMRLPKPLLGQEAEYLFESEKVSVVKNMELPLFRVNFTLSI